MQWYDLRDPNDPELDRLAKTYNLHPLHIEDCRHRNQSAKVEEQNGYLFAVLKVIDLDKEGELEISDIDLFLGRDFLITVLESSDCGLKHFLDPLHTTKNGTRPDQFFYRIMDGVVDSYLPKLDHFNETIDNLEDVVLESPTPEALSQIFGTKRSLIQFRRVLTNMRDVASHLQRTETELFGRDMLPFLRDVYDHLARSLDMLETARDLLNGTLDVYLSSVANRTNQVMKVLTVLSTIALPAIVISGIYGMNVQGLPFEHAPGLVTGVMLACTVVLLVFLKLFRWL